MWNSKEMNKLHTQHLYHSSISTQCDDVIKWKKKSALLAPCVGNSPVAVNFPHKGQWRRALIFSSIWAWINAWVNIREAGDLNRHRTHYDVIAMDCQLFQNDIIDLGLLQTVW